MPRTCPPTPDQTTQRTDGLSVQPAYKPEAREKEQVHPIHRLQQAAGNRFVQAYLARQTTGGSAGQAGSATQAALNHSGGGQPLPSSVRTSMQRALGTDLSQVRTHTAPQAARELQAKAFTSGQDIYFGAGQYQPHTSQGQHLLAHELAHTVQQGTGRATTPQQSPQSPLLVSQPQDPLEQEAETVANQVVAGNPVEPAALSRLSATHRPPLARQEEETPAPTPTAPTPTATEVPVGVPTDEISLAATFEPTAEIASYLEIQGRRGGEVRVRLGNLAAGVIPVNKSGETYQTSGRDGRPAYKPIPLLHPALQPIREAGVNPVLAVRIQNNTIEGYVTIARNEAVAGNPADLVNWIKDHSREMGWLGMDVSSIPRVTNQLQAGTLSLQLTEFPVSIGGYVNGTASFGLENEAVTFAAGGTIRIPHLTEAQVNIEKDAEGNLSGGTEIPVQIANFSGNLIAQFRNGIFDIRGTVGYQAEKFSGEVTLLVTDRDTARNVARNELPPDAIAASAEQASGGGEGEGPRPGPRALAGFGTVNFAFTEWMTGRAQVIIDNEGHITVVGEIAPPAEIELFPQRDYIYDLFTVEVRTLYGVPLVGNVFLFANIGMQALAKLGPGKIYNIAIRGRYSTDPNVLQNFEMEATLNISAFAGLRLRGEGGVGVELLGHDIKAGVGVNALAGIRGYVEATPVIGYRETADPEEGRQGEYFFRGHMEIAAQPFLGLSGDLFVELDSPWWSPAPDERWTWPLGELEYPLPGEFGIGADVDYVIGSDELPEIQMGKVDFDSSRFMTDLMNDHVPRGSQGEQEQSGEWQEDQTEDADDDPTATAQTTPPSGDPASPRRPGDEPVPASPQEAQNRMGGMEAIAQLVDRSRSQPLSEAQFTSAISELRRRYRFSRLDVEPRGEDWHIRAAMSDPVDFTVEGAEQPQGDLTVRSSGVPRDFQPGAIQYNADGRGRARRAQGWLANAHGGRAPEAQSQVSGPVNQFMEQLASAGVAATNRFDAGHLIGDRYGGSGGAENLVPMEARMNRSWFSAFEGRVNQHVVAGEAVHTDVTARYDDSNPFRDLIDPGDIPLNMFERAMQIFGLIPHSITFTVGTRDASGNDHVLFSGITFSPRQRITFTLGGAARDLLIGGESPVGARQVFQTNPNPDES